MAISDRVVSIESWIRRFVTTTRYAVLSFLLALNPSVKLLVECFEVFHEHVDGFVHHVFVFGTSTDDFPIAE